MIILVQFIERKHDSREIYYTADYGDKPTNSFHGRIMIIIDYRHISPRNELRGYGIFRLVN